MEKGEITEINKLNIQLSIDGTEGEELSMDTATEVVETRHYHPRMSVSVALGITVGWIFACAGLFKLWEEGWTYAESCYFMFIRLSLRVCSPLKLLACVTLKRFLKIFLGQEPKVHHLKCVILKKLKGK